MNASAVASEGPSAAAVPLPALVVAGFIAGFVAVPVGHQPVIALMSSLGLTPATPYPVRPAAITGVPQILSTAFWGGLWGIALAWVLLRTAGGRARRLAATLFGALGPTLIAWFVVAPIRGLPLGNGFKPGGMATGLFANGAWGLVTALVAALLLRRLLARGDGAGPRA